MHRRLRSYVTSLRSNRLALTMLGRPTRAAWRIVAMAVCACLLVGVTLGLVSTLRKDGLPGGALEPPAVSTPVPASEPEPPGEAVSSPAEGLTVRPVQGEVLTPFGWMYSQVHREWRLHGGCDLRAEPGETVLALTVGRVVEVTAIAGDMRAVIVDHGHVTVTYANLDRVTVITGQRVEAGDPIGELSDCAAFADTTGPHLRLEMRVDGELIDPMPRLPVSYEPN